MENELIYKSDARRAILKADPYVIFCIDNIKPVDAVEVVHGEWSTIEDDYCGLVALHCSVCNQEWWFEEDAPIKHYHYCPNCGARMNLPQITEQTKDALMKMGENAHGERREGE